MEYFVYYHKSRTKVPITTKVYIVSLGIALDVPALRDNVLIAHKCLQLDGWVVTHALTGTCVARGNTRKQAIDNAQKTLLMVGNDGFLTAIKQAEIKIKEGENGNTNTITNNIGL